MTAAKSGRRDFVRLNDELTKDVVARLVKAGPRQAVIAEAPPGAGKSTLTTSVARSLIDQDKKLRLAVVTQTNEQADDLVTSLANLYRRVKVTRMVAGSGPSEAMASLEAEGRIVIGNKSDEESVQTTRIVVSTARKWQYERSRLQESGGTVRYPIALIDEAYQMRSDMLLGIAGLYDTLFCVGDPGQLDPFTVIDDTLWKGLPYSPSRSALGTLRAFHPSLEILQLPTSWRLPPSAAGIVAKAFYPYSGFEAGTTESGRMCVMLSRHRHACIVVGRAGAMRLLEEFPDSDPMFLDEPEKFPDGWEANHLVLQHLISCKVD